MPEGDAAIASGPAHMPEAGMPIEFVGLLFLRRTARAIGGETTEGGNVVTAMRG